LSFSIGKGLFLEITWGALIPAVLLTAIAIAQLGLGPGLIGAFGLLLSLVAHECGHLIVAALFGVPAKALGFCWAGAFTRRESSGRHHMEFFIALGGPLVSVALMWACVVYGTDIALWLARMNLFIVVTNLIPFGGSDGRRAYNALKGLFSRPTPARTVPECSKLV
jgi:Zn-dependent protease